MPRCDAGSSSSKHLLQEENDYGVPVPRGVEEDTPRILLSSSRDLSCRLTYDILYRMLSFCEKTMVLWSLGQHVENDQLEGTSCDNGDFFQCLLTDSDI